jgi:predicted nucleotidyltransferase
MHQHIQQELKALEQRQDIKILYAVESGSRAWGFESVNSDWDVRFLYVHKPDWYLSIDEQKETIEEMLPEELDLSGWELRKALKLFRKSNPPLMEWLRSPLVYQENYSIAEQLRKLSDEYFNPKACLHHYFHMAEGNFKNYLQEEMVRTKKYFYVLRPLLACGWIEKFDTFPPMEFNLLVENLITDSIIRKEIELLLLKKRAGEELGVEPKIDILHRYIVSLLDRFREFLKQDLSPKQSETERLNSLFRAALKEVWKY